MKKIILIIFWICGVAASVKSQDSHCMKSLRTGTFIYPQYRDKVIIKRTKNKQIEYIKDEKTTIYMKIEWLAEDRYTLTILKIKGSNVADTGDHKFYVYITSCENGLYHYQCKSTLYGDSDNYIKKIK